MEELKKSKTVWKSEKVILFKDKYLEIQNGVLTSCSG